ncbi:SDR family oxidoreductase [Marinovum sp. 2_MG-2023]|uniref:SDR family NAD(P)-dependent oxidoreductase n=1 Tax=unclassified Marinovum TaxID=2647166 RepID=UPI0026E1D5B1|nr:MULTISPECIES: SDR family oxidoreductase [unclassified Marinovum]MDO6732038.1 SDR family oxidoreductase [Marinovum sp. 2_MG-2023]MDO6781290.1 SDR family oxidoreductase [Marinovum sp. 1_MG-2023]
MSVTYSEFSGRHVMVTGAASGIGRATALAFAAQGAQVTAVDLNADGLADTAALAHGIAPQVCDLADGAAMKAMQTEAVLARGPVTVLVNNAGVDRRIPFDQLTAEDWRWMMAVNLDHHALLSGLVAPDMAQAGGGAIVNLSSTAWMKLAGNLTAYHAAKSGIVGLTRGLARDLGPQGIRANAIAPGRVVTERVAGQVGADWVAETHALQCIPDLIRPEDIADCALWLASDAARMVTGQCIVVDGGVV